MKKLIGVWLDSREAHVVSLQHGDAILETIASPVESYRPVGGAGSSTPYGPQDKVSESKFTERKKHQFQEYYHLIIDLLRQAEAFMIMGPAEAKKGLEKAINQDPHLKEKLQSVETAGRMTPNQLKARVKDFFKSYDQ